MIFPVIYIALFAIVLYLNRGGRRKEVPSESVESDQQAHVLSEEETEEEDNGGICWDVVYVNGIYFETFETDGT